MKKSDLKEDLIIKKPQIDPTAFIAKGARIIGDVIIDSNSSIWYNTVARADINSIQIGHGSNVQDNSVIHLENDQGVIIGNNVTIGHNAIIHGCTIKDRVLIGMGAIVLDNCIIESDSIIAAGAVVTMGTHVKSGEIYAGVPAKKVKEGDFKGQLIDLANKYVEYSSWFKKD